MFTVFNILIVALVLLIAYWWANQGLFSAILHLICVIVAGAIALSVWEPIMAGFFLKGSGFDDYAWGTMLIGVFAISLVVLRQIMDRIAPANVDLPHWANLGFGFPVGAAAGILTIGIFVIGAGMIQSTREFMGFAGKARARKSEILEVNKLWMPVHSWTADFYGLLSVGSLYPTFNNTPLWQYEPDLQFQAASLLRDSAATGRAKFSLPLKSAQIQEFLIDRTSQRYLAKIRFDSDARDFGEQLTLSSSQIRLIGSASGSSKAKTVHPDVWTQYSGTHRFDDVSHYITSEPGQSEATVIVEFPGAEFGGTPPKFLQIRNTRYRLPAPTEMTAGAGRGSISTTTVVSLDPSARNIQSAVEQTVSIRPVNVSTNQLPPGITVTESRFIDSGEGDFTTSGGDRPSRALIVQGIFEPPGTRIVQVDVSRESEANIFGAVQDKAGDGAKLMLVDSKGRTYLPIGFIHQKPDNRTTIKVDLQSPYDTMKKIPALPSAGGQPLRLLFAVTDGETIVGFKVGEVTVGRCNLTVRDPKGPAPPEKPPTAGGGGMES